MHAEQHPVLDPDDLNDADRRVLNELQDGRGTPTFIAERTDTDRSYVSQRLKRLSEHGHVDRLETGLYELVDDPRPGTETEDTTVDVDALRDALADAQHAHEQLNGDDLEAALDRMEAILDGE